MLNLLSSIAKGADECVDVLGRCLFSTESVDHLSRMPQHFTQFVFDRSQLDQPLGRRVREIAHRPRPRLRPRLSFVDLRCGSAAADDDDDGFVVLLCLFSESDVEVG